MDSCEEAIRRMLNVPQRCSHGGYACCCYRCRSIIYNATARRVGRCYARSVSVGMHPEGEDVGVVGVVLRVVGGGGGGEPAQAYAREEGQERQERQVACLGVESRHTQAGSSRKAMWVWGENVLPACCWVAGGAHCHTVTHMPHSYTEKQNQRKDTAARSVLSVLVCVVVGQGRQKEERIVMSTCMNMLHTMSLLSVCLSVSIHKLEEHCL